MYLDRTSTPRFIMLLSKGIKVPIHGDGRNIRSFLFAADAAQALDVIFHRGTIGMIYNISSSHHMQVCEVAGKILEHLPNDKYEADLLEWAEWVDDRPYNDSMYWTDASKLELLGWEQRTSFDQGLEATIRWYLEEGDRFWASS
ncbi:NAD(P)-binding protein [Penicillium macrosclerotiorum]|uniref:NAD(P)-binding protein n=1 Tax=Penicillium macrosclerotiorum TaxID=303699 RepID=UPI0025480E3A|nr:NAD(P)-binding protein [Penicillium macrosclerotiorum]KAJ5669722.1 NAD(P)-binding protein [Penicillium macrosclerotiorum]